MCEKVLEFLEELVEKRSLVLGYAGYSEGLEAFKGLVVEVTLEGLPDISLNDSLHLPDGVANPICRSVCDHLFKVVNWVDAANLFDGIILFVTLALLDPRCLGFCQGF